MLPDQRRSAGITAARATGAKVRRPVGPDSAISKVSDAGYLIWSGTKEVRAFSSARQLYCFTTTGFAQCCYGTTIRVPRQS